MIILYGIKNCDTVKKAMKWLNVNAIAYQFHDFRVDGINEELINDWLQQQPLDKLVNQRSTTWKQLDETTRKSLTPSNAAALCVQHETLVKRPVLAIDGEIHLDFDESLYSRLLLSTKKNSL